MAEEKKFMLVTGKARPGHVQAGTPVPMRTPSSTAISPAGRLTAALAHARQLKAKRVAAQQVRCTCCGREATTLVKDHNHETDEWRGMVCRSCNAFIGYVEWALQHPEKTEQILDYLKRYDPTHQLIGADDLSVREG